MALTQNSADDICQAILGLFTISPSLCILHTLWMKVIYRMKLDNASYIPIVFVYTAPSTIPTCNIVDL